jgi:hypothetical protein
MDCMKCAIAKLKRSNAMLKVAEKVPNPKWIEGQENVIRVTSYRRVNGKYEMQRHGIPIPREIPNPNFDRDHARARGMDEWCAEHGEMMAQVTALRLQIAQEKAEQYEALAKTYEKASGRALERRVCFPIQDPRVNAGNGMAGPKRPLSVEEKAQRRARELLALAAVQPRRVG